MRILVVNAGSSSLKLAVLDDGSTTASSTIERWEGEGHLDPVSEFVASVGPVDAVGHRVVHGGPHLVEPTLLDADVLGLIEQATELAPLHNPRSLAGIRAVEKLLPDLPAVACFDTAFHADLPLAARTYALPKEWNDRWSLRRYGFHGLSHAYAVRRAAELVGRPLADLRVVSCHLGAGASLAAVLNGRSVDTTMGFTPLEGMVMATRSGSVDPGLLVWLLEHSDETPASLADALEKRSGLLGLSGVSGDVRDLLAAREAGDADAALALDVFVHRLRSGIAAMTAATEGLDLLVLTGGIGEHSPAVRAEAADGLAYLGVALDPRANDDVAGDTDITADGARVRTVVVAAGEEVEIARETARVLTL